MKDKFESFSIKNSVEKILRTEFKEILKDPNPLILDTNFLFITFEQKIDLISELERIISSNFTLYIYEGTIKELISIQNKTTKNKKLLPLIAKMLNIYNFKIIISKQKYIDKQILENLNDKVIIATNDKKLRMKIQSQKKRVIYMRQKRYLELK